MIRDWLFGTAAILAILGLLRLLWLIACHKPAPGRVISLDLEEGERLHERDMHLVALFDGKPTTDDIHWWPTGARVAYDVEGEEYRSDVWLIRHTGDRPEMHPVIWYDPRDPARATGIGPGPAVLLLLFACAVAVVGWHCPF